MAVIRFCFVDSSRPEDQVLDVLLDEIDGDGVLRPSGYDDVGVLLGRNTELLKCWFNQGGVLQQDSLQVSPSLLNVSHNSPVKHYNNGSD